MGTPLPLCKQARGPGRASLLLRLATPSELCTAELHPQGALLLAGAQTGDVLLFATSSGGLVQRLGEPGRSNSRNAATCVAWAELGGMERVVAGHKSGTVRVWNVERAAVVATLPAHRADVSALAAFPALGLLATGSSDTNIKLWKLSENAANDAGNSGSGSQQRLAPLQVLKGHGHPITQLQFTPDGDQLISGDAGGGLRVWQVAQGAQGRLLHDLAGQHSAAITGIACHPEERLFATCSLDRTLRAWDMDSEHECKCIGVHGPEGRREVRALAFTSTGSALLAAYPDGLRTFTLDPLEHRDTAELQWKQVTSFRYTDGKAIGVSLHKGDADLFGVDLTRMRPFAAADSAAGRTRSSLAEGGASAAASAAASAESSMEVLGAALSGKLRFSDKYQVAAAEADGAAPATIPAAWPVPAGSNDSAPGTGVALVQAGPAVDWQRRQAAVLEPRAANSSPGVEVFAPAPRRPAPPASFTAAAPSRPSGGTTAGAGALGPEPLRRAPSGRISPGADSSGDSKGSGRHRLSAEENGVVGGDPAAHIAGGGKQRPASVLLPPSPADQRQQQQQSWMQAQAVAQQALSMLDVSSHHGFLAAGLHRSEELRGVLQAKRGLWHDVTASLRRGDAREAVRLLRDAGDLCVTANVVKSRALQRHADRFTLDLCCEVAPLARQLLASCSTRHHQAALQLLDSILGRWGTYVHDALSNAPRLGKVDLELERRQERSRALRGALQQLAPVLERLAVPPGGGRAQHMLERLRGL